MKISHLPSRNPLGGRLFLFRESGEARIALEWSLGPRQGKRIFLDYNAEDRDLAAGFAASLFSLTLRGPISLSHRAWTRVVQLLRIPVETPYDDVDIIYLSIHDAGLWWSILHPTMSWRHGTSRWRSGSWHPVEKALGRPRHQDEDISKHDVEIDMPEGSYRWKIRLFKRRIWPHGRLPFSTTLRMFDGEGDPIPRPGKGTTAYNCAEDASCAMGGEATTIADAIALVQRTVMNARLRYGSGYAWRPTLGPHGRSRDAH